MLFLLMVHHLKKRQRVKPLMRMLFPTRVLQPAAPWMTWFPRWTPAAVETAAQLLGL
jgi:hypothetical protein